ncbi:MAG: hypothetical protein ACI9GM_000012 [Salibacteraceae bacterium]|jgi:hypothetical protein
MKRVLFFVVMLVSVVTIKCRQDPQNDACFSADLKVSMEDSICVLTCKGVCACNGVTYCNECEAMKQGFEVQPGDTIPCSQK